MAEKQEQEQKKRRGKNGYRRVTVTLAEAEYTELVQAALEQMREPNNLLSFVLKGRMTGLLSPGKAPDRTAE